MSAEPIALEPWTIAKLDVKAGDVVVVRVPGRLSTEIAERVEAYFSERVPSVKILVVDQGVELSILRPEGG
jgi:hypothetical protein